MVEVEYDLTAQVQSLLVERDGGAGRGSVLREAPKASDSLRESMWDHERWCDSVVNSPSFRLRHLGGGLALPLPAVRPLILSFLSRWQE